MVLTRRGTGTAHEMEVSGLPSVNNEKEAGVKVKWIQCMDCDKWLENDKVDGIEGMSDDELLNYEFYCRMCMMVKFSSLRTRLNEIISEKCILETNLSKYRSEAAGQQDSDSESDDGPENWADADSERPSDSQVQSEVLRGVATPGNGSIIGLESEDNNGNVAEGGAEKKRSYVGYVSKGGINHQGVEGGQGKIDRVELV